MESSRRFIKDVEGFTTRTSRKFRCEFQPLCFSAGKSVPGLTQFHVAQPDFLQGLKNSQNPGLRFKQFNRLGDFHIQYISDGLTPESYSKSFTIVSPTFTLVTCDPDIG